MAEIPKVTRTISATDDCIAMNRMNLGIFLEEFQTAVNLFTLLERGGGPPSVGVFGGVFSQYRCIAAREAALVIYHFGCTLNAINKLFPYSSEVKSHASIDIIVSAISHFRHSFPHANEIRQSIAHAGELFNSVPKLRASGQRREETFHGGSVGGPNVILRAALYERTFTVGKAGSTFSLAVDDSSTMKLINIIQMVNDAFRAYDERLPQ